MRRLIRDNRGSTLIELLVAVAVLAILAVAWAANDPGPVAGALADRTRAIGVLQSQLGVVKALPPAERPALDGQPFSPAVRELALLPEAEGRVEVRPYRPGESSGLLRVALTMRWHRRAAAAQELTVSTLLRGPAPAAPATPEEAPAGGPVPADGEEGAP